MNKYKIISWNVNGINSLLLKKPESYIKEENADIICFQETKGKRNNDFLFAGYKVYWNDSSIAGYSGTCTLVKDEINVISTRNEEDGRVLVVELEDFYVVNCYVPNSGEKLKKLDFKLKWFENFIKFLNELREIKKIIVCGDFNVAANRIDIERPDANTKTAGYTVEERALFNKFLKNGWVDTFRDKNPNERCYSFWSYRNNARAKNIGWRLDYCIVGGDLEVVEAFIRTAVMGSDHCPVGLIVKKN